MAPHIDGLSDLVEVGRGGFGVVYRGQDTQFRRKVAVKVLNASQASADTEGRFLRECQALGALSGHPNIVAVYQSGSTAEGQLFLSMEFLSGNTAGHRVAEHGPASPAEVLEWGTALAGALETAHRAGIVHRDVKPANILFSSFGTPKLVDFGIARMSNAFETSTGNVTATLNHAAPEVLEGKAASPSADIYALASTLHQLLTGYAPFHVSGETSLAPLISRITTMPAPDLRQYGVPDPLAHVIACGLAKRVEDRYRSAGEMGEALRQAAREMGLNPTPLPIASGSDIAEAARIEQSGSPYEYRTLPNAHPAVGGAPTAPGGPASPGGSTSPGYAGTSPPHVSAPTPMPFAAPSSGDRGGPPTGPQVGARPSGDRRSDRSGSGRGPLIAGVGAGLAVIALVTAIVVTRSGGSEPPTPGPSSSTWTSSTSSGPTTSSTTTSPTTSFSPVPVPSAQPVQLGKALPFTDGQGTGTFTVNKVDWVKSDPGSLGGARSGYLLIVNVTQTATKGTVSYNSLNYTVIDASGRKVYSTLLLDHEPHFGSGDLSTGQTASGNIAFDVAKGPVTLSLQDSSFNAAAAVKISG